VADTETPKTPAADKPKDALAYEAERLVAESYDFFGEPSHVVAGALHGERKKHFTRDEAKALIRAFKKQPVSTDNDGEEG
jgi:hypothetical protein